MPLTSRQYQFECIRRHHDYKEHWLPLLLSMAEMATQLKECRTQDKLRAQEESPVQERSRTPAVAAVLASTREMVYGGLARKWPHFIWVPEIEAPFYADTTQEEWNSMGKQHMKKIRELDEFKQMHAPKGAAKTVRLRKHAEEFSFRLQVFDLYQELKNFTQVGQRFHTSESNVRRAYAKVYFDIYGEALPTKLKERRAAGIDPSTHIDNCTTCRSASSDEEMCPQGRAFINMDVRAGREVLTGA